MGDETPVGIETAWRTEKDADKEGVWKVTRIVVKGERIMYKNAGIKSKKEAAQRLINGEVFYLGATWAEIKFDPKQQNPFRFADEEAVGVWAEFATWQVKVDWRGDIGDGVLCWVWDEGKKGEIIARVVGYAECGVAKRVSGGPWAHKTAGVYRYIDDARGPWVHAEPLTPEETKKFILGERDDKNS